MQLVITMAGRGTRVSEYSGDAPKWSIRLKDRLLIEFALDDLSLMKWDRVIVVCRKSDLELFELETHMSAIFGTIQIDYVALRSFSPSQVHSVLHARPFLNPGVPFFVQNIDTWIKLGFDLKNVPFDECDIFLPTFSSTRHDHSYIDSLSQEVVDRVPISNIAVAGLYGFRSFLLFDDFAQLVTKRERNKESTISDVINHILWSGYTLRYASAELCVPLGTTAEIDEYLENNSE